MDYNMNYNVQSIITTLAHIRPAFVHLRRNECICIADNVLNDIHTYVINNNVDPKALTNNNIKKILKSLNYTKHYEHSPHILHKICGHS